MNGKEKTLYRIITFISFVTSIEHIIIDANPQRRTILDIHIVRIRM